MSSGSAGPPEDAQPGEKLAGGGDLDRLDLEGSEILARADRDAQEALASGLPVAAYPVTGPLDIVTRPELGALDPDLGRAVVNALRTGNPTACVEEGRTYTWENCTRQFLANLVPVMSRARS